MPVFDDLQRASFDGIEFPVKRVTIKGRYRHFEHEYLRVPGAVIEKLERSVYDIEMEATLDVNVKGYGALWPTGINALQKKFESGVTGPLVIPTIGTIPAFQPTWDRTAEMGRLRSGEMLKLVFKEDQTERFVQLALVKTQQQSMQTAVDQLAAARLLMVVSPADASLFDKITGAVSAVLAIKDRADLYGGLLAAKLARLTQLLNQCDTALESLKHPTNYLALEAFLELWNSAVNMATNLAESPRGPRLWTVPRTMSVADIAAALYGGSTERANEIMLNNRLDDPFAVTAGTKITYFVDAGLIAA